MSPWLDEPLRAELDPPAAHALAAWCSQTEISLRLARRLTGGRSAALVAAVLEQSPGGARQLIMKLDRAPGSADEPEPGEFAQHERALRDAPDFAGRHLTRPVHQPVPIGDGRWFAFQRVAGGSLRDPITLHTLLDAVLHPPRPSRAAAGRDAGPRPLFPSPRPAAEDFAAASGTIIRSVLDGWVGRAQLPSMDVPDILRHQLGHRLAPGGALLRAADAHRGPTIHVEDEDDPLPNPFALVLDTDGPGLARLPTFIGRAHGDLHVENVLVPAALQDVAGSYRLIDLARYRADAVLTWDPTHLVLHVLARTLVDLSPSQRGATIDLLLDPDLDGALVPLWLSSFVGAVRSACEDWAHQADLVDQWRDQVPLSVLAVALTCHARPSTREQDRGWFLRLAANAATVVLDRHQDHTQQDQDRQGHQGGTGLGARDPRGASPAQASRGSARPSSTDQGRARVAAAYGDDLVISYVPADQAWAAWISWHLEAVGWHVEPLEADTRPARRAPRSAVGTGPPALLVVLSPAYLDAARTSNGGRQRPAFTVRVEPCEPPEWLAAIETVDLVGVGEEEARTALVGQLTPPRACRQRPACGAQAADATAVGSGCGATTASG